MPKPNPTRVALVFFPFIICICGQMDQSHAIYRNRRRLCEHAGTGFQKETSASQITDPSKDVLGSSPKKCNTSKCNGCVPCQLVTMYVDPIDSSRSYHHENSTPYTDSSADVNDIYYPQTWRCQCNGKLHRP
ncbi:hypothetical protein KP509_35G060200 [Ceratopteris richardii]|uniref:Epidermal patterning factor-like protein n=1 Tax=Ceratopteris richardii TaxID=49495 RepID=A0A8T2QGS4_CERRI|nr:hypothetical protein KP509_35G060200 [Ceratopteris richardii]